MQMMTLKAPGGLENLTLSPFQKPEAPRAGEILVRVYASSLNYHDLKVADGSIPTEDGRIPLSDAAGVVEAVGEGVSAFRAGDAVVSCFFPLWQQGVAPFADFKTVPGDGVDGYARPFVTCPASWFTHAPKGYSHEEAATLTTAGLTAWRALVVDGQLKAGDTVLTLGTGGVSVFACQIAKAMGATVIATSSSDTKLEKMKALGADHLINYTRTEQWGKEVLKLTEGRGATHVIEVGGPGTLAQSLRAVAIGGHIAMIGILTGLEGVVPTMLLVAKQARVQGLIVGSRAHQIDMVRALESTGIKPVIDKTFALSDLAEAFRYEQEGKHFGKICIRMA